MTQNISIALLDYNKGQLKGLPKNPRFFRDYRFEAMKKSIEESPEMLELRELIVFPYDNGRYVVVCGNLEDIEAVSLTDEDGNDVSDLFDYDAFFEQFKRYEVKFLNGTVIKSGETVIGVYNGYPKEEVEFLYRDTLKEVYICKPTGDAKYKFPRSYKKVLPATEENLSRLYNR